MPDYEAFYNLLRKEGRVGKDFASEIAEELVTLLRLEAPSGTDRDTPRASEEKVFDDAVMEGFQRGLKAGNEQAVSQQQCIHRLQDIIEGLRATAPTQGADDARQVASDAARDVVEERERQVSAEGWTPEHDDEHNDCEMVLAAIVYAESASGYQVTRSGTWPWHFAWFKPTTPRRDLVKAAALILAEIERLDRAAASAHATNK